jgi:hypothetical protein
MKDLTQILKLLQAARHLNQTTSQENHTRHIMDNLLTGIWGELSGKDTRAPQIGKAGLQQYKEYIDS